MIDAELAFTTLTGLENLYWSWEKVKRYYASEASWRNELEIAQFEANLQEELWSLSDEFQAGTYSPGKLRPLAQPKLDRETNSTTVRQMFWFPVRDQVAWVAFLNVIGPELDRKMPKWSYGNRLYRPAWFEQDGVVTGIKVGPYRSSASGIYRKFTQTWPLYRRHIHLTLKHVFGPKKSRYLRLDESSLRLSEIEQKLPHGKKLPYLEDSFWIPSDKREVYWASADFEKFYPNLHIDQIHQSLIKHSDLLKEHIKLNSIANDLLKFTVDTSNWDEPDLKSLGLTIGDAVQFDSLPTGLMVAGFLANVAMLDIDLAVSEQVQSRQIAHFRYVDDHVFLATSPEALVNWLSQYESLLKEHGSIAKFNWAKLGPDELRDAMSNLGQGSLSMEIVRSATKVEPRYPKPFMTKTLERLSALGQIEFELLDDEERGSVLSDLELLLVADIGDSELQESTRLSFAASLIARFAPRLELSDDVALLRLRELRNDYIKLCDHYEIDNVRDAKRRAARDKAPNVAKLMRKITGLEADLDEVADKAANARSKRIAHSFSLLVGAIHAHPDKLRLWRRAVEFCANTGHAGLHELIGEIDSLFEKGGPARGYMKGLMIHEISLQITRVLRTILREHASYDQQLRFHAFVSDAESSRKVLVSREHPLIHDDGVLLLDCCLWASQRYQDSIKETSESFSRPHAADRASSIENKLFRPANSQPRRLREAESFGAVVGKSEFSAATWLWWLESALTGLRATTPTIYWKQAVLDLPLTDESSWVVLSLYPGYLPENAWRFLDAGNRTVREEDWGWLLQAAAMQKRSLELLRNNSVQKPIEHKSKIPVTKITLREWTEWAATQVIADPWDPRVSEWTCLKILSQAIEKVLTLEGAKRGFIGAQLSPENIYVPRSWLLDTSELGGSVLSWERWELRMSDPESSISVELPEFGVKDGRYLSDDDRYWLYPEMLGVRAAGLILFGLLRKSFDLPAILNVFQKGPVWFSGIRPAIQEVMCSSWSTAILEACLLPRSLENILLSVFEGDYEWDKDTTDDPPVLRSLDELLEKSVIAYRVLHRYQVSISDNKPRQLIPLLVEQMPDFDESEEHDRENDPII